MSPNLLGGKVRSIPAYYEGQNANGVPDHYESAEQARILKSSGRARSIHRGTAILILGPRRLRDSHRESIKQKWAIVGQTTKFSGLGRPRWNLV